MITLLKIKTKKKNSLRGAIYLLFHMYPTIHQLLNYTKLAHGNQSEQSSFDICRTGHCGHIGAIFLDPINNEQATLEQEQDI